jgi:TetR/AcrR family transcriptional regulator
VVPDRPSNERGRKARVALLDAATGLFAERGYAGVSIADVAAAAGTTKPSVLYHFDDKDQLWKACVDRLWGEVNAFYDARRADLPPSRALLEFMLTGFVEAALRWPAYVRIPFIEGASPSWRSDWIVDHYFGAHVTFTDRMIRICQRQGSLPPGDPAHFQSIFTSGINVYVGQAAMWSRAFGRPVDDQAFLLDFVERTLDLTFRSETMDKPAHALIA